MSTEAQLDLPVPIEVTDAMQEKVIDLLKHKAEGNGFQIKALRPDGDVQGAKREAEILLYGEIGDEMFGGVSAKTFAEELKAAGRLDRIVLRINSPGGSVFDGLAIHNTLRTHPAPVEVHVDGLAASAASIVAMAGDPIFMADNAMLMIHDPWALCIGTGTDMRAMAESLDKVAGSMATTYAKRAGKSLDEARAWMAAETWFAADDALKAGLITGIDEAMKVAAHFDLLAWRKRFKHPPAELFEPQDMGVPTTALRDQFTAIQRRMATVTYKVARELDR